MSDTDVPDRVTLHLAKSEVELADEGEELQLNITTNQFVMAVRDIIENTNLDMEDIPRDGGFGTRQREGIISGMKKAFKQDRKWQAIFPEPPLGYELDSNEWITPAPDEKEMVEDLFMLFLNGPLNPAFTTVAERFNEIHSDHETTPIRKHKVKDILQKTVYIGSPQAEIATLDGEDAETVVVEDSDLQLINESVFNNAQKKINSIEGIGTEVDQVRGVEWLESEYDRHDIIDIVDDIEVADDGEIAVRCPDCNHEWMQPYTYQPRESWEDGVCSAVYRCADCGRKRVTPKQSSLFELMKLEHRQPEFEDGEEL